MSRRISRKLDNLFSYFGIKNRTRIGSQFKESLFLIKLDKWMLIQFRTKMSDKLKNWKFLTEYVHYGMRETYS